MPGERLAALQFLLNLVGDVNDPLLAIDKGDQGGQCTAVRIGGKPPVRLSTYWQTTLVGEVVGRDPAAGAARLLSSVSPADMQSWAAGNPESWALESYQVAKTVAYAFPADSAAGKLPAGGKAEADGCGEVVLYRVGADYETKALAAVKQQLTKGGLRLAQLLRDSFKYPPSGCSRTTDAGSRRLCAPAERQLCGGLARHGRAAAARGRARRRSLRPLRRGFRPGADPGGAARLQHVTSRSLGRRSPCRAAARRRGAGPVLPDLVVRHAGDPEGLVRPGLGERRRVHPAGARRCDPSGLAQHQEIRRRDDLRLALVADEPCLARPGARGSDRRPPAALRPRLPLDLSGIVQHRR